MFGVFGRLTAKLKRIAIELSSAASGQVASALPLLMVAIFLARTSGLTAVGYFSAATGVSAVAYQVALFGARNLMVVDQLRTHTFEHYVYFRCLLMLTAFPLSVFVGLLLGIPMPYLLVGIAIKLGDALVDLNLGYDQITKEIGHALRIYSRIAWTRLVILSFAMSLSWPLERTDGRYEPAYFIIFGCLIFAVVAAWATKLRLREFAANNVRSAKPDYAMIIRQSAWYGVASLVCATLTALPRFLLPSLATGDYFGVAGASLSAATLFGMIYYAAWLRSSSRFSKGRLYFSSVKKFVLENVCILGLLILGSVTVFPIVVAYLFKFSHPDLLVFSGLVMATGSVFFATMNCANLFKATSMPWLEPLTFALPAIAAILMHWSGIGFTVPVLLGSLSVGMAVCIALGLIWLRRELREPTLSPR